MSSSRPTLPELAGKLPDAEVAALTDASVSQVLAYRRAHRIQPYVRSPPGRQPELTVRPAAPALAVVEAEEDLPDEPEAPPEEPSRRRGRTPTAEGKLARYRHELGKVSDGDIARRAGLSLGTVGAYRRTLGIPAYTGFLWQKGHEPVGGGRKRKTATGTAVRGHRSDIDALASLVGTVSDALVAKQAGVSRSAVTAWRRIRGVPAAQPHRGRPPQAQAPAQSAPRREAHAAPAPAAVRAPDPGAGGAAAAPVHAVEALAFSVVARRNGEEAVFLVVGADIADAARRARDALLRRSDGPWRIESLSLFGDAIDAEAD